METRISHWLRPGTNDSDLVLARAEGPTAESSKPWPEGLFGRENSTTQAHSRMYACVGVILGEPRLLLGVQGFEDLVEFSIESPFK